MDLLRWSPYELEVLKREVGRAGVADTEMRRPDRVWWVGVGGEVGLRAAWSDSCRAVIRIRTGVAVRRSWRRGLKAFGGGIGGITSACRVDSSSR